VAAVPAVAAALAGDQAAAAASCQAAVAEANPHR
jgi:hypothetical protein